MIYRRFGKTGLDISILSAGFMRAMHSWKEVPGSKIPATNQMNFDDIVNSALENGINHFETANAYGTSEQQLGKALKGIPRNKYILQTKVQPERDSKRFIDNFNISLSRLNVDSIDLLAVHGINDYSSLWQACREGGCLAAARTLQKEGRVGSVGFSGHGPLDVILEAIRHERDDGFDYMNLHWYYIYQVNSSALEEAAKREMGVFIISPTDKGGMLHEPPKIFHQLCRPMEPITFNDVYCLLRPEIHTISIGASRPSDFKLHLESLNHLDSRKMIAEIDEKCTGAMARETGFSRPEALWSKLPTWEKTPGLINIPFILWLYNLARGWRMLRYATSRYNKLGRDVQWVPGNNGSRSREYDLSSIARAAGIENDELVALLEDAHHVFGQQEEEQKCNA